MNTKDNLITVADMLRYIAGHEKAVEMNKDLVILRETAVDPIAESRFFIGKFRCFFEDIGNGKVMLTCPGLRIFHGALTEKLVDKLSSRYSRRLVPGHEFADSTDLGYLFSKGYRGILGYWYYDERTGKRRAYLYHQDSERSYILKFDSILKFLVDEFGMEHCVDNDYKVTDVIEQLSGQAKHEVKQPKSIIQRICDLFRKSETDAETRERRVASELADWIASQRPLGPEDAKLLEENLWKLV